MTGCPDDPILIRWMAGELPAAAAADLEAHVGTCDSCRDRYRQLRATWDLLGQLHVKPPVRDLTEQIMSAAERAKKPRWLLIGRLAAAIALAAGLGVAAGLLTPVRHAPDTPAVAVSPEELLARTGLDVLVDDESIVAHIVDHEPASTDSPQEEAL